MPTCEALVEIAPGAVDGVTETDGLDVTALPWASLPRRAPRDDGRPERGLHDQLQADPLGPIEARLHAGRALAD
jgi:hypothetical protein